MKNTKLTFYCTHATQNGFEKIIFDTVITDDIKDKSDFNEWIDNKIVLIYDEFNLGVVFDWVIIRHTKTLEACRDINEIKRIAGKLSFPEKRKQKAKSSKFFLSPKEYEAKINLLAKAKAKVNESAPAPRKEYRSCWVEPSGKTHWVGFAAHNEFAANWLEEHDNAAYKTVRESFSKYHYEELENRGWCKILGWTDPPSFVLPDAITPMLKQSLREYCMCQQVTYDAWPEILKS